MGLKIFHLGLCVSPEPFNELQLSFIRHASEYRELSCGGQHVNEKAIQMVKEFRPDLVFMQIQAPNIITYETVKKFKEFGAYVINWTGDVRDSVPKWMYDVEANLTLFSNMRDVSVMSKINKADYLEIGYNEHIYQPNGKINKTNKIVFFGNNYGQKHFPMSKFRVEMVDFLQRKYKGDFGVYGTGWANGNGNFNHSQEEEAAGYRGATIAINCSHYEIERYSSDRLLRILGTGTALCLCKHYPGIEEDFTDGLHLRTWKTLAELTHLIDYYSAPENQEERSLIANQGMELAQEKFTFNSMILNLINIYNASK